MLPPEIYFSGHWNFPLSLVYAPIDGKDLLPVKCKVYSTQAILFPGARPRAFSFRTVFPLRPVVITLLSARHSFPLSLLHALHSSLHRTGNLPRARLVAPEGGLAEISRPMQ